MLIVPGQKGREPLDTIHSVAQYCVHICPGVYTHAHTQHETMLQTLYTSSTQRRKDHQDSRPPHQDSESACAPSDKWLFQIRAVMGLQNL